MERQEANHIPNLTKRVNMKNEFRLSFVNNTQDTDVFFFENTQELNDFKNRLDDEVREFSDFSVNGKEVLRPERYQSKSQFIEQVKDLVIASLLNRSKI